ncbi:MAG: histidinol-phosphate transaminase [Proteobacteria bacterium]|nr:histidinol-phosphate transaminase [Burkholderiales bacterium]
MNVEDRAPAHVKAIAPYQPGKPISELARECGLDEAAIVKLASNENPLGVNEAALIAMTRALAEVTRYPDGNGFDMKCALSAKFGIERERIVLGNGSNDVLELAARAFLVPQSVALYSQHAFAVYPLVTQAVGARGIEVPAREFGHDLDAILAALTPDTRVVFIANPNNPTGTFLDGSRLERFIAAVPTDVLVVLDEAYTDYVPKSLRYDSIAWLARYPNLVVSRTLAKAYGLAGLRVGFGLGSAQVIDLMNRVRQPFNVNSIAQAGAVAVLDDPAFLERSYEVNLAGMRQLTAGLAKLRLSWIPSFANFVTFKVGPADVVYQRLLAHGVIVRPIASYGMPEYLRVSVGTHPENQRFLDALEGALDGLSDRPAERPA